jgi:hypothetical protein
VAFMPSESPFARGVRAERVVRWPGRCAATAVCTNGSVSACVVQCVSSIIKKGVEGWVKTGTLRGLCYRSDRGVRLRCSESCCGESLRAALPSCEFRTAILALMLGGLSI